MASTATSPRAPSEALARELNAAFPALDPAARLALLRAAVPGPVVLTTSFGLEDQVLTHLAATAGLDVALETLDTGRLFEETREVWAATEARYGLRVRARVPDAAALERLLAADGPDGFRHSLEGRRACCGARKVAPLARALAGADAWVTGLRADQSDAREGTAFVAHDPARGLLKASPLLDWPRARALAFARDEGVPLNALHARGFPSVGCAPCTRAVAPGEPERAGRWWWEREAEGAKECGLHVAPDGRLARAARPVVPQGPAPHEEVFA